jgi:hypothetical protein
MTAITLPASAAPQAPAPPAPRYFAAPDAFGVLHAWRAWTPRGRDRVTTGFALLRDEDGTLRLASENLGAESIRVITFHSHRRLLPVAGPHAPGTERDSAPCIATSLRSLDDWAIEVLLRTAATVCRSLVVGLRNREGQLELIAWRRDDATDPVVDIHKLLTALTPWIER